MDHGSMSGDAASVSAPMVHGGGVNGPTFAAGAEVDHEANGFDPTSILRDFDWGKSRRLPSGRVLREWDVVAADKEIEVSDFYRSESKARGTWQPSSASAGYSEAARRAGDRAGRRARIGADREFGGTRGALE